MLPASAAMTVSDPLRSMSLTPVAALFAGVFDPGRRVDLADHAPVFLVGDWHEAIFGLELGLQRRAFPREGEERILDLGGERRIEIVGVAITGGGEGLGLVDRPDLRLVDHLAIE